MNGTTTNQSAITVIVSTIAILAVACVGTICLLSYFGTKVPPELNTLTGGLVGYLGAMLTKTSPTETIKQPDSVNPAPVKVVNKISDPVPTKEENQQP